MNISTWIGLILIYDRVRALQIEPTEAKKHNYHVAPTERRILIFSRHSKFNHFDY